MIYGYPLEIITDRGKQFLSESVQEFERRQNIEHLNTPYHPQTNGMVERMHGTLNHAITTLAGPRQKRWDEFLQMAVLTVRVRTHSVTK